MLSFNEHSKSVHEYEAIVYITFSIDNFFAILLTLAVESDLIKLMLSSSANND